VAELGIEPVGLCGDMAFSTIFKSKFSNLTITFDAYHVIMALIKNFSGKFPTFLNMLKLTSETSHRNEQIFKILKEYVSSEEKEENQFEIMKFLLPHFDLGSTDFNKSEIIEMVKKFKPTRNVYAFLNNILVSTIYIGKNHFQPLIGWKKSCMNSETAVWKILGISEDGGPVLRICKIFHPKS